MKIPPTQQQQNKQKTKTLNSSKPLIKTSQKHKQKKPLNIIEDIFKTKK